MSTAEALKYTEQQAFSEGLRAGRLHIAASQNPYQFGSDLYKAWYRGWYSEIGERYGIGNQSMVWQYLSGKVPLSLEAAGRFARGLGCTIHDFSPMLADQLKTDILPWLGPRSWWRGTGKALLLVLAVALVLPSPQPAHASFSSHVAAYVYYIKSWLRRLLTGLVRKRTLRVQVVGE